MDLTTFLVWVAAGAIGCLVGHCIRILVADFSPGWMLRRACSPEAFRRAVRLVHQAPRTDLELYLMLKDDKLIDVNSPVSLVRGMMEVADFCGLVSVREERTLRMAGRPDESIVVYVCGPLVPPAFCVDFPPVVRQPEE